MGDIGLFTFPYQNLSVPNGIPFYPKITQTGKEITVTFNQGYVFDFTSVMGGQGVKKIMVDGCDTIRNAKSKSFYLKITTGTDLANVTSATIQEGEPTSTEKSHYSAKNISGGEENEVYKGGAGVFNIPMCKIDGNGNITNLYLRENIHWQKINFENTKRETSCKESIGVLYNWGDEDKFNDNPTVKFSNLVQLKDEDEQIIKLKKSEDGQNIVVTSQLPLAGEYKMSVLYRSLGNKWVFLQADETKYQILVNANGELKFFDTPESASEGTQLLSSDGNNLKWFKTEELEVDICKDNYPETIKILVQAAEE